MRTNWIAVAALAFGAAVAPSATPQSQEGRRFAITFSEEGSDLAGFVATAAGITGEPFFVDPDELKGVRIHLPGTTTVPASKFMPFFDLCVRSIDFAHVETMVAGTRTHRLVRLDGIRGNPEARKRLKTMAQVVDPTELPRVSDRATLVTTTFTCKNLPAWTMATTLQLYFADSATEAIRTIEGTDFLLMTGSAAHVASVVKMCERLDAEALAPAALESQRELKARIAALEAKVAELAPEGK